MRVLSPYNPLVYPGGRLPGIDPSHIAALGCKFSGIATQGGNFRNILTGQKGTKNGAPTTTASSIGPALVSASASNNVSITGNAAVATPVVTMACIAKFSGVGASRIFSNSSNGVGGWDLKVLATAHFATGIDSDSGSADSGIVLLTNVPYFLAASQNGTDCNFVVKRLDNGAVRSLNGVGLSIGSVISGDGTTTICGDGQGDACTCSVAAAMWNTQMMSVAALLSWATDPWAFWYPPALLGAMFSGLGPVSSMLVGLSARTALISYMRAGQSGVVPLLAKSSIEAHGTSSITGVASLTARTNTSVRGRLASGTYTAALSAIVSVAGHALGGIVGIATALGQQVGMPQGFLFRPGTGPTWDVKRRAAFPDSIAGGPSTVALFARSFAAGFARANASGAVPLTAKSAVQIKATDGLTGAAPLAAKTAVQAHARDSATGAVPLAAKATAVARAKGTSSVAAALSGLASAIAHGRAGVAGTVPLLARSAVTASGRGTMSAIANLTAVAGRVGVAAKARATMTVTLALSATAAVAAFAGSTLTVFGTHTVGRPLKNANIRLRTLYNQFRRNS